MATTSALEKYFQKSTDHVLSLFEKGDGNFSKKDFHDVRVEIKRIKALAALLEIINKKFSRKKFLQPFETIFNHAARVREPQVKHEMISKFKSTPVLTKLKTELKDRVYVEHKKFSKILKPSLKKDLKKKAKEITRHIRKADVSHMKDILLKKRKKIEAILEKENLHPRDVHEMRKRIKRIYYLQKIFQPRARGFSVTDQFQELLGKWHDGVVLEKTLEDFRQHHIWNGKENKSLETMIARVSAQNDKLLQSIQRKRKDL